CETARQAVENADVVVTATFAREPVLQGEWLKTPVLVNAMGSNYADRREIPAEVVKNASLLVADDVEQCRIEAGDYLMALERGEWSRVHELSAFSGPQPATGGTVFKSVGLGLEDV